MVKGANLEAKLRMFGYTIYRVSDTTLLAREKGNTIYIGNSHGIFQVEVYVVQKEKVSRKKYDYLLYILDSYTSYGIRDERFFILDNNLNEVAEVGKKARVANRELDLYGDGKFYAIDTLCGRYLVLTDNDSYIVYDWKNGNITKINIDNNRLYTAWDMIVFLKLFTHKITVFDQNGKVSDISSINNIKKDFVRVKTDIVRNNKEIHGELYVTITIKISDKSVNIIEKYVNGKMEHDWEITENKSILGEIEERLERLKEAGF